MPYSGLVFVLRFLGIMDCCALIAVFLPREAMEWGHRFVGLGEMPSAPLVDYLTRSASAAYALHGCTLLYAATDVVRHWNLIRFLGWVAQAHGLIMLGIDLHAGMPLWWTIVEPLGFAGTGAVVLVVQRSYGCPVVPH